MAIAARRLPRTVVAILGLLFLGAPSPSVSANSCAALRAWAQPLAGSAPTLDDLGRYDRAHRHALFGVLTPAVQAALWREQITRFGERPELSPAQRALAQEGIALLTPALYQHEPASRQAFASFWQRAAPAFADAVSQSAWSDLGASSSTPVVARTGTTYCECKLGGGTGQCGGVSCVSGACTSVSGCGISGTETCNGMCNW